MPYVEYEYYAGVFEGESVDNTDFSSLRSRAEEIIEEMTMYRLTPMTFLAMPEHIQTKVKNAVCAQIEYLDTNEGIDTGNDFQSASLGKFSYSKVTNGSSSASAYSPRAQRILLPTGLLSRRGGLL